MKIVDPLTDILPFYRTKIERSGIGLALCRRIMDGSGARMRVESERGKGSTFYVTVVERR